jgi:DNA repair protein RadA/Sms
MAKPRTEYVCQQCGGRSPKWMGRCAECGEWNTLLENLDGGSAAGRAVRTARASRGPARSLRLRDIDIAEFDRLCLPLAEFSRVLGGGIVKGSLVLIGGDPGVGKSTLLMHVANLASRLAGPVLYVSGEESLAQVGMRARRLGLDAPDLMFSAENDLAAILEAVEASPPATLVIDSIQSVFLRELESSPGSVSQLRECTMRLMHLAKSSGIAVFLIGHVTKEGAIAGPKVLEHMVDTVLYLEGDRFQSYRLLRSTKNRFGPTHEVGVFEMREDGMAEVANPSAAFLAERGQDSTGSTIVVAMEGSRPLLVEVQALASRSALAVPRRACNGVDFNRLLLITAVLTRRLGTALWDQDLYVNVVGGLTIDEPAADLGVALAIVSSFRDRPVDPRLVAIGELGLSGELRAAAQLEHRLREASKLGFQRALIPRSAVSSLSSRLEIDVVAASTLREAVSLALLNITPASLVP